MSVKKKNIRQSFRSECFARDNYICLGCGLKSSPERAEVDLDAHHITPREEMPFGGYVKENGITLCKHGKNCHLKAETWLKTGYGESGFSPEELYAKIKSSRRMAEKADA
jgi:5-methylcytosine-specific restriction endonuclease McrA